MIESELKKIHNRHNSQSISSVVKEISFNYFFITLLSFYIELPFSWDSLIVELNNGFVLFSLLPLEPL